MKESLVLRTRLVQWIGVPLTAALVGCASVGAPRTMTPDASVLADDVNRTRAFLPLEQIEPIPRKPVTPAEPKELSERSQRQIAAAQRLLVEQRYTEAAIELQRALRYDPNHPRIHRTLAILHLEAGNTERARQHAGQALEENPDDAVSYYVLGRCEARAGQQAAAIVTFRTAMLCSGFSRDPSLEARCRFELAESLNAEGYLQAALSRYEAFEESAARLADEPAAAPLTAVEQTVALLPADRVHLNRRSRIARSRLLDRLGRPEEAAAALAPVYSADPDDSSVAFTYASLLTRAGRLDGALAALRHVDSNSEEVIELLQQIHARSPRPQRVIDELRERAGRRPDDPRLALALSEMLQRIGRSPEAAEKLEAFLDRNPDARGARLALMDVLIAQAEWSRAFQVAATGIERRSAEAEELAERLIPLMHDDAAVRKLTAPEEPPRGPYDAYLRGVLAQTAGMTERARHWLERAYADDPGFVPARIALGRLYLDDLRYDEAIRVARRSDPQTPQDARLERLLGEIYDRLDDLDQAELHFQAAVQLDRGDTESMLALARLLRRSGQLLRAQRQLRVLLDIRPDHEDAREFLAFTYLLEQKPELAIEQLEELQRRAKNPLTKERSAALLEHLQKPDAAAYRRKLLDAMHRYDQEDATTWLTIAESYDPDEEAGERYKAFRQALELEPNNEDAALGLVDASLRLLRIEEAAQRLQALVQRRPNRDEWRLDFGRRRRLGGAGLTSDLIELYLATLEFDAALQVAREGEAREGIEPGRRRQYRSAMIEILRAAGRPEEVIARLRAWAEEDELMPGALMMLAEEYVRQDQPDRAAEVMQEHFRLDPTDRHRRIRFARALALAGKTDHAAQLVLDWMHDDPDSDAALLQMIFILERAGRYEDALELVNNHLLHTFDRERFQDQGIALLAAAGRLDECRRLVETLLEEANILLTAMERGRSARGESASAEGRIHRPNEPYSLEGAHRRLLQLRLNLVRVLLDAGAHRVAQREASRWLDMAKSPRERFEYLRWLSFVYRAMGNDDEATDLLARALLLQPDDQTLNNDVAYGWIDRGVSLEEAERMIRYALSRTPSNSAFLDTYGWLLYKQGRFDEAGIWLERALKLRGGSDPVVLDHLGDTHWRLGDQEAAIEHWEAALATTEARPERAVIGADEQRLREVGPQKIEDARAGREPAVAPIGGTPEQGEEEPDEE